MRLLPFFPVCLALTGLAFPLAGKDNPDPGTSSPQHPVFPVLPPEELSFHFPDPPREGGARYFPIAENGEARCFVVHAGEASPRLRAAISEFARYLGLSTGARIRVYEEGAGLPVDGAAIHVGKTERGRSVDLDLPDLQYGESRFPNLRGFLVKTLSPDVLLIRGVDEDATAHGLVGVLKHYLGIRQYWYGAPEGIGTVIPKHATLSLPELEWRDWPYIASFQMSLRPFGRRPYLDFYRRKAALPASENYSEWLRPSLYVDEHPEYFALVNGKRLRPTDEMKNKGWQPCVSNPEVQEVMARAVIQHFRDHPGIPGINVAINDGGGDCTCEKCRALDAPNTDYSRGTGMSDRYVFFTNRICEIVGREFPDKWIVYLAYANASAAPQTVKPHPRLLPVTTTVSTFDRWDEWVSAGSEHLGIYAHHLGTFAVLPKMDARQQTRRLLYAIGSGKARTYYMEAHTQWPHADLVPYLTAELLWDPRSDVDQLIDDYFSQFYGSASSAMQDYYGALDEGYQRWLESEGKPHWFGKDISSYYQNKNLEQFLVLSPDEALRAAAALERALASARPESPELQRVQIVSAAFRLQQIAIDQAWAAFRLRDTHPKSLREAHFRIDDARLVFQRSREAGEYIASVLEKEPMEQWKLYRNSTKPLQRYEELKSGEPEIQLRSIISLGLYGVEQFLRDELGQEEAAKWWLEKASGEPVNFLRESFEVAAERALSPPPRNLVEDPGFESLAEDGDVISNDYRLDGSLLSKAGVHLTFPDRTLFRCSLDDTLVHSGRRALRIEHCARARFSRHVPAGENKRFRAGLRFHQGEGVVSSYVFSIDVRLDDGSYETLSTIRLPDEPGKWRQVLADVTTPPGTKTLFVRLHVTNQAAGTACWIDDVWIEE